MGELGRGRVKCEGGGSSGEGERREGQMGVREMFDALGSDKCHLVVMMRDSGGWGRSSGGEEGEGQWGERNVL